MSDTKGKKEKEGAERRRTKRVAVQESFSLFLVIPKVHGMARVYMRDLSRLGLRFHSDLASEFKNDQHFTLRLYTNPVFYLPIECRVVRAEKEEVALEFVDPEARSVQAVGKLLDFLEVAGDAGVLS